MSQYCILYSPPTFNFMEQYGRISHPNHLLSFMSGKDVKNINNNNYMEYFQYDPGKQRKGMADALAVECNTLNYIGNMIAKCGFNGKIVLADGKRRTLQQIIQSEGEKPAAVFITAMSANFPSALTAALALNHGEIPVVIGGIHVSTSPADVSDFLRKHAPFPGLIAEAHGPADSKTITRILEDLASGQLKKSYTGQTTLEDGIWGYDNVIPLPPHQLAQLRKIPLVGPLLVRNLRINMAAPYLGCPYRCRFCSISTLPRNQKALCVRNPEDFVSELKGYQKQGINSHNRLFLFAPDNLLLGGRKLEEILDRIISERLTVNFAAQISIEVADRTSLLRKLRQAGATHFFIGFESLDLRNLEYVNKNVVNQIRKSGQSVVAYYRRQIKKIQRFGISIHGAFIFGLPYDYFNNKYDHTGIDVAGFCVRNHIGLQPSILTDLPGSLNFKESQKEGRYLYGKQGTWEYLVGLCLADLGETNRVPFESLHKSPLLSCFLAYEAIRRVGGRRSAMKNAIVTMLKAMAHPSRNGVSSLKGRLEDGLWAFASQISVSLYKDHADLLVHSVKGNRGVFERLYTREQNPHIRKMLGPWVSQFIDQRDIA